jgi:hypothetical protein
MKSIVGAGTNVVLNPGAIGSVSLVAGRCVISGKESGMPKI